MPSPTEYDDAVRNLNLAFIDTELKSGKNDGPVLFPGAEPGNVASGGFATIYRIKCGSKRYAVKCFTQPPPENQCQRFLSIHEHLLHSHLKCAIDFQFLEKGIRVRGTSYPILKMEWVEAPTLLKFLAINPADRERSRRLSESFFDVCVELRNNKIAHGDLQHGNLLVSGSTIKIIDYDGMCVPGTNGLQSVENGLPHYQHHCRNGGKLTSDLDHFSTLVIWTSLYALSLDPSLWQQHIGDSERLLFQQSDFSNPQGSSIFKKLDSFKDARLTKAVSALRGACFVTDLGKIPHLADVLMERVEWWKTDVKKKPMDRGPLPVWIDGGISQNSVDSVLTDNLLISGSRASVVTSDKLQVNSKMKLALINAAQVDYGNSVVVGQVFIGIFAGTGLLHAFHLMSNGSTSVYTLALIMLVYIASGMVLVWIVYLKSGISGSISKIDRRCRTLHGEMEGLTRQLATIQENIMKDLEEQSRFPDMVLKLNDLQKRHREQLYSLDAEFSDLCARIDSDCKAIDLLEKDEIGDLDLCKIEAIGRCEKRIETIEAALRTEVVEIQKQIRMIEDDTEKCIEGRKLEEHRKLALGTCKASIENGKIAGWACNVSKLHDFGIYYANDILKVSWEYRVGLVCTRADGVTVRVSGISSRMADNLHAWLVGARNRWIFPMDELKPEELHRIRVVEAEKKSSLSEISRITRDQYAADRSAELSCMLSEQERFKELRNAIMVKFRTQREDMIKRRLEMKTLYAEKHSKTIGPLEMSIKYEDYRIAKQKAEIMNRMKNSEPLKNSIESDLARKANSLMFLKLQKKTYQTVCFRHYLSRLFTK